MHPGEVGTESDRAGGLPAMNKDKDLSLKRRGREEEKVSGFRKVQLRFCLFVFFFNFVLMWKIVGVSEVSVIYIYIYIYRCQKPVIYL